MLQGSNLNFARTKILCTLGPATSSPATLVKMIKAGMDGVRLNFSHGNFDFFDNLFLSVHEACVEESTSLAILADLQGPKIRIGELSEPEIQIFDGDEIELTIDEVLGTNKVVSTSYKPLPSDARINDVILIDDGLIKLTVSAINERSVVCKVVDGGVLKPKKGMNLPGMRLSTPSLTQKDIDNLNYLYTKHRVDFIALSFVRNASDIIELRQWINKRGYNTPIIAKIEKPEAVDNLDEILKVSDGLMVARGDLGVEMKAQEVPLIQKMIIKKCNEAGKIVITATQMLESMISNPVPTRAEASDVANAVWDGTDVVMLSGETSVGKFPIKTVETMNQIVRNAGSHFDFNRTLNFESPSNFEGQLFESVNKAIVTMSREVKASAIVVFTENGRTARGISKFKPEAKVIAISGKFETMNNLCLKWGVTSIFMKDIERDSNILISEATKMILETGLVEHGDVVIFTSGTPVSAKGRTSTLRIFVV
ncbi:MAG: pyruvate kinase [Ignavibacteriaceae bacterium]|nr:pyruvate kinase [Ignavibacteriaceae bacterium]